MTPPKVPLLDIASENAPLRDEILAALTEVVDSGRFLFGPDVNQLEAEVAELCQTPHAISCASGSDALLLAMMATEIGPGDQVIMPSFTFFATASCVWRLGADVVFVDIEPGTFNIDPQGLEAAITDRTKAVIPVHLFGQSADMEAINTIARQHGIKVVEDAAQAIGAGFQGRACGSWGDMSCISFYPTKNLGGMGDGGMLTTRDEQMADRLRLYSAHGMRPRYYHSVVGINSRLDTFQAAALRVKLKHLGNWNRKRAEHAAAYQQELADCGLGLPVVDARAEHVWNQYTLRVPNGQRDALRAYLADRNIGSEIYYPIPLHRQDCFRALGYQEGSLPVTEQAAAEVLSLPVSPSLTVEQRGRVVEAIRYFMSAKAVAA